MLRTHGRDTGGGQGSARVVLRGRGRDSIPRIVGRYVLGPPRVRGGV
jgi:hypothetical protein